MMIEELFEAHRELDELFAKHFGVNDFNEISLVNRLDRCWFYHNEYIITGADLSSLLIKNTSFISPIQAPVEAEDSVAITFPYASNVAYIYDKNKECKDPEIIQELIKRIDEAVMWRF